MTRAGRERRKQNRVYATRARRLREEEELQRRLRWGRREINWKVHLPAFQGQLLTDEQQRRFDRGEMAATEPSFVPTGSEREKLVQQLFADALGVQARRRLLGFA